MLPDVKMILKTSVPSRELEDLYKSITGDVKKVPKDILINMLEGLEEDHPEIKSEIGNLINKYRAAGRIAVSWGIQSYENGSGDSEGEEQEEIVELKKFSKELITELVKKHARKNPFERDLKPPIKASLALNSAEWVSDDILKLGFVYAGKERIIVENYEPKRIRPTMKATLLLRLGDSKNATDDLIIECRVPQVKSNEMLKIVSDILKITVKPLGFTEAEIGELKKELKGVMRDATIKPHTGGLARKRATAAEKTRDLADCKEYKAMVEAGDEIPISMYHFMYKTSDDVNVRVTITISKRGHIFFKTETSEEVIDYVLSRVRKVKGIA